MNWNKKWSYKLFTVILYLTSKPGHNPSLTYALITWTGLMQFVTGQVEVHWICIMSNVVHFSSRTFAKVLSQHVRPHIAVWSFFHETTSVSCGHVESFWRWTWLQYWYIYWYGMSLCYSCIAMLFGWWFIMNILHHWCRKQSQHDYYNIYY